MSTTVTAAVVTERWATERIPWPVLRRLDQHATRDADRRIADALDTRVRAERPVSDEDYGATGPGGLVARTPSSMIGTGASFLVEPRGFAPSPAPERHSPLDLLDVRFERKVKQ